MITGASRGIGAQIAQEALRRGQRVAATARNAAAVRQAFPDADPELLLALPLDVTDPERAQAAVRQAAERFGGIDVLVNNAGRGLLGAVEEVSDAEARTVFDTNVFGTLTMIRAVLPVMRARADGHVINFSSVGGFTGSAGWGVYNATKFAVEGLSEALALEVAPLGIRVTIVEPGYFRTTFLDASSLRHSAAELDAYTATTGATRAAADAGNHQQPGDPAKAARVIVELPEHPAPPLRLQLGTDCVARVETKLASVRDELERWRAVAESTNFAD
jgi:NAD(P)-dependent dehydrogenase (short-subunit alcohol dehydrogenase family)